MKKIMFVCYGNICRSPLAEFVFKDIVKKAGKERDFYIQSSATSTEEIGNPVYRHTAKILDRLGIDYSSKRPSHCQAQISKIFKKIPKNRQKP